jgi:hypothetical protein
MHAYIAQTINDDFGFAREVGGMDDHVHILCDVHQDVKISEFMRHIKATSSGWMHREFQQLAEMSWQEGYGAFTVSASRAPAVKRYIDSQEEHHSKFGFEQEFRRLLEKHGIEFDAEYLF